MMGEREMGGIWRCLAQEVECLPRNRGSKVGPWLETVLKCP